MMNDDMSMRRVEDFDNEVNRIDSEDEFGEGEVEDTQFVKSGGLSS